MEPSPTIWSRWVQRFRSLQVTRGLGSYHCREASQTFPGHSQMQAHCGMGVPTSSSRRTAGPVLRARTIRIALASRRTPSQSRRRDLKRAAAGRRVRPAPVRRRHKPGSARKWLRPRLQSAARARSCHHRSRELPHRSWWKAQRTPPSRAVRQDCSAAAPHLGQGTRHAAMRALYLELERFGMRSAGAVTPDFIAAVSTASSAMPFLRWIRVIIVS